MRAHLDKPLDEPDFAKLADGFTRAAKLVPDPSWNSGTPSWASLAKSGAEAAQSKDLDTVKQTCKSCHRAFRSKYKTSFRPKPLPI